MPEKRRKFDAEFREGAVRLVREIDKPTAQVAADRPAAQPSGGRRGLTALASPTCQSTCLTARQSV